MKTEILKAFKLNLHFSSSNSSLNDPKTPSDYNSPVIYHQKIADIVQLVQMLVQKKRVIDKINGIVFIVNTYTQWNQCSHAMLCSMIYEQLRKSK